jgi:hypothetical protein
MSEASQARFELPRQQIRHLLLLLVSTWRRGATGATTLRTGHLRLLLLLVGTGETPRCVFSRCRRRRPRASRRWCRGPRAAHTQISARAHKCQFISLLLHQTLLCARNPELGTHECQSKHKCTCTYKRAGCHLGDVEGDGRVIEVLPLVVVGIVLDGGGVGAALDSRKLRGEPRSGSAIVLCLAMSQAETLPYASTPQGVALAQVLAA